MSITILTRPVRRFLAGRLGQLREALETLGARLRESVAQLLGPHTGDAIREAVEKALRLRPAPRRYEPEPFAPRREQDFEEDRPWGREPSIWDAPEPEPRIEEAKAARPKSVPAAAAEALCRFVRSRAGRPSLLKLVGVGAAITVTTLLGVPLLGGALLSIVAAFLLARLAGVRPANATSF